MKNVLLMATIIESIKQVTEGLTNLTEALELMEISESYETPATAPVKATKVEPKEVKVDLEDETEVDEEEVGNPKEAELQALTYNQLKALCKEAGLKAGGTKDDLIQRLLEQETEEEEVEEEEEVIEDEESEVEEEEDEEEEEEEAEETIADKVERELAEYTLEDLAEILESIGKSTKGKRQALLSRIVQAIEDGELDFETEDGEEVEEEVEEEVAEEDEVAEEEEVVEEDEEIEGEEFEFPFEDAKYFNLEEMTQERHDAVLEKYNEVVEAYNNNEISEKDIDELCLEFYDKKTYTKKLPIEDKVYFMAMAYARFVDDDGVEHEAQDPYTIDEAHCCCGHFLEEDNSDNYTCPICKAVYEIE